MHTYVMIVRNQGGVPMKKILLLLISLSLLSGCVFQEEPSLSFEAFIESSTNYFLDGTTSFNLNYILNNPENDGESFGLGFASEEEYIENLEGYEGILKELKKYKYKDLNETEQFVYTSLKDYLERQIVMKDYYYHENDYIGSYSSVIQELPLLLEMYTFMDKTDLEYYFQNITAFKDDFLNAVAFEKERQEMGLGYSKLILDDTKSQIQDIIDEKGADLIANVNTKIDELNFLTEQEKVSYKDRNKTAIQKELIGAYQALLDGLNTINGQENNISIQDKDYYEAVVFNQLGIKTDIDDIEEDLYDLYNESYHTLFSLLSMNPELLKNDDIYDIPYEEFNDVKSGLDYLKTKIFEIVPTIDNLEYEIYTVPKSLQDGFAPAAYLTPKIDMTKNQKECIMINPSSSSSNLLPTLVHEGYPGHMYQHTYLRQKNYPQIMYLIDCIGYSEGWAIYMENRANEFLEKNTVWQQIIQANDTLTSSILGIIDIGIHSKGWNYQHCIDFFNQQTGSSYTTELQDLYNIILQTPGYYLYYIYAGDLLHSFYEDAKEELGPNFDEIEFHQAILDSGAVGLDIVKKNVEKYIDAH